MPAGEKSSAAASSKRKARLTGREQPSKKLTVRFADDTASSSAEHVNAMASAASSESNKPFWAREWHNFSHSAVTKYTYDPTPERFYKNVLSKHRWANYYGTWLFSWQYKPNALAQPLENTMDKDYPVHFCFICQRYHPGPCDPRKAVWSEAWQKLMMTEDITLPHMVMYWDSRSPQSSTDSEDTSFQGKIERGVQKTFAKMYNSISPSALGALLPSLPETVPGIATTIPESAEPEERLKTAATLVAKFIVLWKRSPGNTATRWDVQAAFGSNIAEYASKEYSAEELAESEFIAYKWLRKPWDELADSCGALVSDVIIATEQNVPHFGPLSAEKIFADYGLKTMKRFPDQSRFQ